ncbi:MAG TPA: phosphopantothenoylcysteine decarboxylase, partial [Bacteroidales bacterium]|nr:phosphopantothenoylcysteine decarboxylase [Bacteroidales bacterium]
KTLQGKHILITAGPTQEKIDPVRYISNYSTGKMGYALAEECRRRGAEVTLISGPTHLHKPEGTISVTSSDEMYKACIQCFPEADITILCAAVADFSPCETAEHKIKRGKDDLSLQLRPTHDIARALGDRKRTDQLLVGFALETDHEEDNAIGKMQRKHLDYIVLNSLQDEGAGFGGDTNKVTIFSCTGQREAFPLKDKRLVAQDILNFITHS